MKIYDRKHPFTPAQPASVYSFSGIQREEGVYKEVGHLGTDRLIVIKNLHGENTTVLYKVGSSLRVAIADSWACTNLEKTDEKIILDVVP